jgi:pyrimidine operon attenuation protein / uracil phosphoribosyltransferase
MDRVKTRLMDAEDLGRTLDRLARQIVELIDFDESSEVPAIVGMQTRGVHIARRLVDRIRKMESVDLPLGILDATMYRDDFRMRGRQPVVRATDIPFDVRQRDIILADDVLFTGRTARAALDRGHRELPICADLIGRTIHTLQHEEVRVRLEEIDGKDGVDLVDTRPDDD